MNGIEQTPEYYDARWEKTISLLPNGGDYRIDLRNRAWKIIADYIGNDKKVFEFATGVSNLPEYLKDNNCKVSGCDFSQVAVDFASEFGNFKKSDTIFGSDYDVITACQFIEHILDPAKWIREALEKAPIVICSIPNNFRQVGDHYQMQWKNWVEFDKLFEEFEVVRLDTPEMYAGNHVAWNHPIFTFKLKGKKKMHPSIINEINEPKKEVIKPKKKSLFKKKKKKVEPIEETYEQKRARESTEF
jgi:hypothetical protein